MSKARTAVAKEEDDLSVLQHEMEGIVNQIDAHHREEDGEDHGSGGGNGEDTDGVLVEEADSAEEVGIQAEGGKARIVDSAAVRGRLGELAQNSFWRFCVACRRRTRTPSGVTWGFMAEMPCL